MIDQDKIGTNTLIQDPSLGGTHSARTMIETNTVLLASAISKQKNNKPINLLESRGSAMLKAALNSKTSRENLTPPRTNGATDKYEERKLRLMQQAVELKNRKRSPKNNVLFTEPVVTQEFEYEPTFLPEPEVIPDNSSDCEARKVFTDRKSCLNRCKSNERFGTYGDEDDDTITIGSSVRYEVAQGVGVKKSTKRTYETMQDNLEDQGNSTRRLKTDVEGLFSSPKVAKIAPYFEEGKPINKRMTESKFSRNLIRAIHSQPRSGIVSSKINSIKNGHVISHKIKTSELEAKSSSSELLSYKKLQLNEFDNFRKEVVTNDTDDVSPQIGYFGWLTNGLNFLTNQMNKYIF